MSKHPSGLTWQRWNWPFKTQAERKLVAAYFEKIKRQQLPAALMALVIALALPFAPAPAQAQSLMLTNKAGGRIVITLRDCTLLGKREPVLRKAYGYSSDGLYLSGCWAMIDDMIHIIWEDNGTIERRVYNPYSFVPLEK
jgi:hypothetical protein